MGSNKSNIDVSQACGDYWFLSFSSGGEAWKFVGFIGIFVLRSLVHHFLKPLGQPYLTTEFVIGMILGNIGKIRNAFSGAYSITLNNTVEFGMICHMFVLGLEMNPYVLFKPPTPAAIIAYCGMLSTFVIACSTTAFMYYTKTRALYFILALSVMASGNSSPILTRVITNLKIPKSDIGKLGVAAGVHTDMMSMLLFCIGFLIFPSTKPSGGIITRVLTAGEMACLLLVQIVFTAKVSPLLLNWVNNENPEGKPLKGSHLVMSIAFMVFICSLPTWYMFSPLLSAFTAGLFCPNQGRMSRWIINKMNYLLNTVFYLVFFFWVGYIVDMTEFNFKGWMDWARFFLLLGIVTIGKVLGTVLCGSLMGFSLPETASLGLLLTAKGHVHIFLTVVAIKTGAVNHTTGALIVFLIFLTVVYTPFVVMDIIKRARRRVPVHMMALQWLETTSELRVLIGVHGLHNIRSTINLMEISKGGPEPGSTFYTTDMIELTDEIAATMQRADGVDNTEMVTDSLVTEMRDQITAEVQSYGEKRSREGVTVKRLLALSTFNTMPQDICTLAEDLMVSLIVLPFHKKQDPDGTLDDGNPGFRYVNRKVLRNAPCSVGILVDRSFGKIEEIAKSAIEVAIIFMGGPDDREALAFAGYVARHPGVKLKVIRFLLEKNSQNAPRRASILSRVNAAEQEEEMKLDDECFANFYERYVAGGRVSYIEKHLANSSETFTALKSLEGEYSLIIVGRGGTVTSVLTIGLNDWQQCPELGPIGDVLSGSDFSDKTSVLIIQQQRTRGQLDGLHDDFSIM